MSDFTIQQDGDIWSVQAHAMSHPYAQELDQLRAELAAAKRAQMMLQAVCTDLHRQLRERDGKTGGAIREGVDRGEPSGGRRISAVDGLVSAASVALTLLPETDRRLGRGNGAME